MSPLLWPLPFFLLFELWQLVIAERYLGIARIEQGADPRRLALSSPVAAFWTLGIVAGWFWALLLLLVPLSRDPALGMILVSICGLVLRRLVSLKWILVSMTFEGAVRIGMMLFICLAAWRRLR